MAEVTLAGGVTGSDIVLSGNDQVFSLTDGKVEFSTDAGTTWIEWSAGEKVVFVDGLTVKNRNARPGSAAFSHMAI